MSVTEPGKPLIENWMLDAVPVYASWGVGVGEQHNLPWARELVVVGGKETDQSAKGAKARTSKWEVQSKSGCRRIIRNPMLTNLIIFQHFQQSRHEVLCSTEVSYDHAEAS